MYLETKCHVGVGWCPCELRLQCLVVSGGYVPWTSTSAISWDKKVFFWYLHRQQKRRQKWLFVFCSRLKNAMCVVFYETTFRCCVVMHGPSQLSIQGGVDEEDDDEDDQVMPCHA